MKDLFKNKFVLIPTAILSILGVFVYYSREIYFQFQMESLREIAVSAHDDIVNNEKDYSYFNSTYTITISEDTFNRFRESLPSDFSYDSYTLGIGQENNTSNSPTWVQVSKFNQGFVCITYVKDGKNIIDVNVYFTLGKNPTIDNIKIHYVYKKG